MTIALNNLKSADLSGLEAGQSLEVTLKGFSFAVTKRHPGQITDYVVSRKGADLYPLPGFERP
jgi:hypothetical protein